MVIFQFTKLINQPFCHLVLTAIKLLNNTFLSSGLILALKEDLGKGVY